MVEATDNCWSEKKGPDERIPHPSMHGHDKREISLLSNTLFHLSHNSFSQPGLRMLS